MRRIVCWLSVLLFLSLHLLGRADPVLRGPLFPVLAWDPSPSETVAGYRVKCVVASSPAPYVQEVGLTNRVVLAGLVGDATNAIVVVAIDAGGSESAPSGSLLYNPYPRAAAPAIRPSGGTIATNTFISLTSATAGASIGYRVDAGAEQAYTAPFLLPAGSHTLSVRATAAGFTPSTNALASYIVRNLTATPTVTPSGGTVSASTLISLSSATPSASILYRVDEEPSQFYSAPFTLPAGAHVVQARASAPGCLPSALAVAVFDVPLLVRNGERIPRGEDDGASSLALVGLTTRLGQVVVRVFAPAGDHYALQGSEDGQTWTTLQTVAQSVDGPHEFYEEVGATNDARFFRVVPAPEETRQ